MSIRDIERLKRVLDALVVLSTETWSNGGIEYNFVPIEGDVPESCARAQGTLYPDSEMQLVFSAATEQEVGTAFSELLGQAIGAKSSPLGWCFAHLVGDTANSPNFWMARYSDEDVWILSVVDASADRPVLIDLCFQYD